MSSPNPENIIEVVGAALTLHRAGRLAEAESLYNRVLSVDPDHFESLHFLGLIEAQRENFAAADRLMKRSLEINSQTADAFANHARVLNALKRSEDALAASEKALAIDPRLTGAMVSRGIALADLGRAEEALDSYGRALAVNPNYAPALTNRGNALHTIQRHSEAMESYEKALAINAYEPEALVGRGNVLQERGEYEEALALYEKVLAVKQEHVVALTNRGNVLLKMHRLEPALDSFRRVLARRPDDAAALAGLCHALLRAGRFGDILANCDKALAAKPDQAVAEFHRGYALGKLGRHVEALVAYERALADDPKNGDIYRVLLFGYLTTCEWDKALELMGSLRDRLDQAEPPIEPGLALACSPDPIVQLDCAKHYVRAKLSGIRPTARSSDRAGRRRLRIAYLSADFREHAVGHAVAGLLEHHDRSRFEVIAVSYGPDEGGEARTRIVRGCDRFCDVFLESGRSVAELLRNIEVDIAVDLTGYTDLMRPEILAFRPAPIQVNYLGYSGTMGAEFIDYIIADPVVLPFSEEAFFSEKIVHLPDCFLPNDGKRVIGEAPHSRSEAGLPEGGFVFCSFNNSWKIRPSMFDVWMRLLDKVAGSVLWLAQTDELTMNNLRREANARGIDPARLNFAVKVPSREHHLARHQLADLFLDTLPYNAHSTAADALRAGLPVLTAKGSTFAGRVAASALNAIGLPELATNSLAEYEELALRLATDRSALTTVRKKLAENRATHALFDLDRYRRHIEAAYLEMWEIWRRGERPRSFRVDSIRA